MKKILILAAIIPFVLTSCVSRKKFAMLEAKEKATQDLLNTALDFLKALEAIIRAVFEPIIFLLSLLEDILTTLAKLIISQILSGVKYLYD